MPDLKANKQVIGWNTWASHLPKDYLAKYVLEAGCTQVALIDDCLPLAYHPLRSEESQRYMTDLYVRYMGQVVMSLGIESQLIIMSEHFDPMEFLRIASKLSLADVAHMLPKGKRNNFLNLGFDDLAHPVMEFYAHQLMSQTGAQTILRGTGQRSLTEHEVIQGVGYYLVDAESSTEQHVDRAIQYGKLSCDQAEYLRFVLSLWKRGHLLRGTSHVDQVSDLFATLPDTRRSLLEGLIQEFKLVRDSSLFVTGGVASRNGATLKDTDCLVLANQIHIPQGFFPIPEEIQKAFAKGEVQVVSLKARINGNEISLRFIHPTQLSTYFSCLDPVLVWRQSPLYTRGQTGESNVDIYGQLHWNDFGETDFPSGGSCYLQPRSANGLPLIDSTAHMILTSRMLTDNGCQAGCKLQLLSDLLGRYGNDVGSGGILDCISKIRPLNANMRDELTALLTIIDLSGNAQMMY